MISRTAMVLVLLAWTGSGAVAQQEPAVDSLITRWVDRGPFAGWSPGNLFEGCPDLAEWQERGIRRVLALDLTIERADDTALALVMPLRECNDPRLEQWFFDHLDEAIERGNWRRMGGLWMGIEFADSPHIREYLRNLMLDTTLPEGVQGRASGMYFEKLNPAEVRSEFLRAFETGRLPWGAWFLADRLLKQDPDRLLREVAPLVRANAALANQSAFSQIVQVGYHLASDQARRELGDALEAGLNAAGVGMPDSVRERLRSTVRDLKQRHR